MSPEPVWRRISPPLVHLGSGGAWAGVRKALEIGGAAFMLRWLLGGGAFYAVAAGSALWEVSWQRRLGGDDSLPRAVVRAYAFFICGVGGLWNAIGHSVLADRVASAIGWATGSPFQLELAAAHLGWGIVGLMAARLNWQAVGVLVVTKCVFLFGAAAVHLKDVVATGNRSPLNAGFMTLWFGDVLVPGIILVLLVVGSRGRPTGVDA